MKVRAIGDLAQLDDKKLFSELSVGINLCLENALGLQHQAKLLGNAKQAQGFSILLKLAEEEAAKCLILIDAARCPKSEIGAHLKKFNSHLARGLYAYACNMHPADFEELMNILDRERRQYYLDGPNDVDWIFKNEILFRRESAMYVDYVDTDNGHDWINPNQGTVKVNGVLGMLSPESAVISIVKTLKEGGCTRDLSLEIIAKRWRLITMECDYKWATLKNEINDTLKELDSNKLLSNPNPDWSLVLNQWPFPLWTLDLNKEIGVNRKDLREIQRKWCPE